jgi:hypothetical protein
VSLPSVDNQTGFVVEPQLLVDRDGEKLCAMVKATFDLWAPGAELELAPEARRRGLRPADVPWGDPAVASYVYASDYCLRKPGTDVLVAAKGYAARGEAVRQFDVGVRAGSLSKVVRVHGFRVWEANGEDVSEAAPIKELALRYDFAWGGTDQTDPEDTLEEPHNPVGRGIARDPSRLTHQPAPQLEDPSAPVRSASAGNVPASVGPIGRHFEPRRGRWGTYDARWLDEHAPLLPGDFDDRANQCASPGLTAATPFTGGEAIALTNLTRGGGKVELTLPRIPLAIAFAVPERPRVSVRPHLDTVVLDTLALDAQALGLSAADTPLVTVELVWRACFSAPRRMKGSTVVVTEVA